MSPERLTVIVMVNETVKGLKRACDQRFESYKPRNQNAYERSPFAKIESEKAIDVYAEPQWGFAFKGELENMRHDIDADFNRMDYPTLGDKCVKFPAGRGRVHTRPTGYAQIVSRIKTAGMTRGLAAPRKAPKMP